MHANQGGAPVPDPTSFERLPRVNRTQQTIGTITRHIALLDAVTGEPVKPARKGRRIRV